MSGNPRKLSQEQVGRFLKLLENLELEDVAVTRMSFELLSPLKEGEIALGIEEDIASPSLEGQKLCIPSAFTILVTQEEQERLRFEAQYLLTFSVANRDTVAEILKEQEAIDVLLRKQVLKLVWPFLRADFHFACSRLGTRPITLRLLR